MGQRGIGRVALVHLTARVDTVIAYRIVDLVSVEVDARVGPVVIVHSPVFDRVVETARATGDLVELDANASDSDTAYAAANEVIIREARSIAAAGRLRLLAVLVWDGAARKRGDATDDFRRLAAASHFDEQTVLTV